MNKYFIAFVSLVSLCLLFILINITNPSSIGPAGLIFVFVLIYLSSFGVTTFLINALRFFIKCFNLVFLPTRKQKVVPSKRVYYYSLLFSIIPVMYIGLKSVGSINVYSLLPLLLFILIGLVYINKRIY